MALETYEETDGLLPNMEIAKAGSDYPAKAAALQIVAALEKEHSLKTTWHDDEEATLQQESDEPLFTIAITAYVDHDLEIRVMNFSDEPSRMKLIQNVTEKNQNKTVQEMLKWINDMVSSLKKE